MDYLNRLPCWHPHEFTEAQVLHGFLLGSYGSLMGMSILGGVV